MTPPFSSNDDEDLDPVEKATKWAKDFFGAAAKSSISANNEAEKKLFRAIEANKIAEVIACIEGGLDPNTYCREGLTPLHVAARRNLPKMAEALINLGADPLRGMKDQPDYLPINEALSFSKPELVRFLAKNGGASMAFDEYGWTIVHRAVDENKKDVVKALLDSGVDRNIETQNGTTPLMIAIMRSFGDIINVLLDDKETAQGISTHFNTADDLKRTAFHWALEMSKTDVVRRMIALGADINAPNAAGLSPLSIAIDAAHVDIVKQLIKAGADINKTGEGYHLPLHFAAQVQDVSTALERIFDALVKAGADPVQADPLTNRTALHFAAANPEAFSLVQRLLALPQVAEAVNARDREGASALHLAAIHLDTESLKGLMAAGANINQRHGFDGATPLIAAARANNTAAVRILLATGAVAKLADSNNKSALFYAREHKNTGMITILEEYVQKEFKFKQKPPSSGNSP